MIKLDNIDRRSDPKAYVQESRRIERERDARMACLRIFLNAAGEACGPREMLAFLRPSDPDYAIRLSCLQLAAEFPPNSEEMLIAHAEKMLNLVTAADNG